MELANLEPYAGRAESLAHPSDLKLISIQISGIGAVCKYRKLSPTSMSKFPIPASCSVCNTITLRVFLRVLTGLNLNGVERCRSPLVFRYPNRSQHPSQLGKSVPLLQSTCMSTNAPCTHLEDTFVPFDSLAINEGAYRHDEPKRRSQQQSYDEPLSSESQGTGIDKDANDGEDTIPIGGDQFEPQITLLNFENAPAITAAGQIPSEELTGVPKSQYSRLSKGNTDRKEGSSFIPREERDRQGSIKAPRAQSMIPSGERKRETWQIQKEALSKKFGSAGWTPPKRLSPDALEGIRALHAQYPDRYTTPELAKQFEVSPENIRRILKSKWKPNDKEEEERRQRWIKRGESKWSDLAEQGIKPPRKWRKMGIGSALVGPYRREGHKLGKGNDAMNDSSSETATVMSKSRTNRFLSDMIL